jgi:ribonuclease BN (tRNA processing enzyme)
VSFVAPGELPVLFDLGTGARYFGATQPHDGTFRGVCLLSHLHWDHAQGLPFFTPVLKPGSELDLYAPAQLDGRTVAEVFAATICPPLFPIGIDQFPGTIRYHDLYDEDFAIGGLQVMARSIPHVGPTLGYRVEWHGVSVAYLSDHQMPYDGSFSASDGALEVASGADLVIHDSQYTPAEFEVKFNWGHCTTEYALWFAAEAGAKRLALFHHDPTRRDDALDETAACARRAGAALGIEVFPASEGLVVEL